MDFCDIFPCPIEFRDFSCIEYKKSRSPPPQLIDEFDIVLCYKLSNFTFFSCDRLTHLPILKQPNAKFFNFIPTIDWRISRYFSDDWMTIFTRISHNWMTNFEMFYFYGLVKYGFLFLRPIYETRGFFFHFVQSVVEFLKIFPAANRRIYYFSQ